MNSFNLSEEYQKNYSYHYLRNKQGRLIKLVYLSCYFLLKMKKKKQYYGNFKTLTQHLIV